MKPDWVRAIGIITIIILLVCFWAWAIGSLVHIIKDCRKSKVETMYEYEHKNFSEDEIEERHRKIMGRFLNSYKVEL